ncbi:MAG: helicase-associated domain-containing protein [Rhodoglobus sp.]
MPTSSDSALALAGQLRSLSDDELVEMLGARDVRAQGIRDFFDLAEALLDPASMQRALGRLDRPTLTVLGALATLGAGTAADVAAHLTTLGADPALTANLRTHLAAAQHLALAFEREGGYAAPAPVAEQLAGWPALGLPSLTELASDTAPTPLAPVSQVDAKFTDHVAAENAFETTTRIAELLGELQHESARELARGGVALPDSKRLATAMGVDLDRVPGLLEIAARAGLAALDSGRWMPTSASVDWQAGGSGTRWSLLAGAWLERLPADIRGILASRAHATWGERLDEYVQWLFPAGGEWMHERVLVYTRDAELLGITAAQVPSTPGVALLVGDDAATAMSELFPAEVEQVYLQHDLTIVSPGPLAPRLDARLRAMADVEGRALASTYRVSTSTIYRAMSGGETDGTIREFLAGISLTGIPQPLDYLLTEAAERYGLVRVGTVEGSGRSYVRSAESTVLRTLLVDHSLAALGLARARTGDDGQERLETRFELPVLFWSLSEARYPVAAENARGEIIVLERPRAVRATPAAASSTAAALIEKLRLGSTSDPELTGHAWLLRQLDVAIKGKLPLTVTVRMPDGTDVDYQLEPASMGGGRLRARDKRADIERTLPLSSIASVSPPR